MHIPVARARALTQQVFQGTLNAPPDIAKAATEVLVDADLRGISSHGITSLPYYLEKWQQGQIVPSARIDRVFETSTTVVFAGNRSIGHYASREAMTAAIEKAAAVGLGSAVVRNSTHNGAISAYTIQAARSGMIGIAATACAPHVAPHGGRRGLHGTNPLSYALPRGDDEPLVFDLSTGYSSAKLKDGLAAAGQLPRDRVLDASGEPTTDPGDLASGWILPVAGHVGFGLALMVDALTAALADSPIGQQMPLVWETSGPYHGSFFCLAVDPQAYAGREAFGKRLEALIDQIESAPSRDETKPVRWPGKQGWLRRRENLRLGIPVDDKKWNMLLESLAGLGVNLDSL